VLVSTLHLINEYEAWFIMKHSITFLIFLSVALLRSSAGSAAYPSLESQLQDLQVTPDRLKEYKTFFPKEHQACLRVASRKVNETVQQLKNDIAYNSEQMKQRQESLSICEAVLIRDGVALADFDKSIAAADQADPRKALGRKFCPPTMDCSPYPSRLEEAVDCRKSLEQLKKKIEEHALAIEEARARLKNHTSLKHEAASICLAEAGKRKEELARLVCWGRSGATTLEGYSQIDFEKDPLSASPQKVQFPARVVSWQSRYIARYFEPDEPETVKLQVSVGKKSKTLEGRAPNNNVGSLLRKFEYLGVRLQELKLIAAGTLSTLKHARGTRVDLTVDKLLPLSVNSLPEAYTQSVCDTESLRLSEEETRILFIRPEPRIFNND